MRLSEYQDRALETATYPQAGTGSATELAYLGLGLGEAGEVQNKIKKILRDDQGILTDARRLEIMKEAGDVLWYIAVLSRAISVPLEDIAQANLEKLAQRRRNGTLKGSGDDR